jgi:hypothetical protein
MSSEALVAALLVAAAGCAADEPAPCEDVVVRTTRITDVEIPVTNPDVERIAADVDGDGQLDDAAAYAMTLMFAIDPALQAATTARLHRRLTDDVVWNASLVRCGDAERLALPDGVPIGLLVDFADTGAVGFVPADADADLGDGDSIRGAVAPGYLEVAEAAFLPYVQQRIDAGEYYAGTALDDNGDGIIAADELHTSQDWQALTGPDLDLDVDGAPESYSFGFGVETAP